MLALAVYATSLTRAADPVVPAAETALLAGTEIAPATAPLVLKIAVNDIYCQKTACECISEIATRDYTGLLAALKQKHQITLQITYHMEVYDLEKAIVAKTQDGVICKPWTALRLAGKAGADFKRVADIRDPDNTVMMTGVFLTLANSPVRSLEDLMGKKIAFGQADSYEKNQAALALLAAKGIKPGDCLNLSSCSENLDALMNGKVDAAVVSSYALTASCAVDFAKPEEFRTLGVTPEMPLTSLLLDMKRVSLGDARRLQAALIDLSGVNAPEDLVGSGFLPPCSWKPVMPDTPEKP